MMNKIENYLNSLDRRNLILLYASIVIIAAIIYYNFNYNMLSARITKNENDIFSLQNKIKKSSVLEKKLKVIKKKVNILKKENLSLNEDLKYLNILIKTSPILHIDEKNFIEVLKDILQKATNNNIRASYTINRKTGSYTVYEIDITGKFPVMQYRNFYRFITDLEKIKAVKEIKHLDFEKKKDVEFNIKLLLWGLR